MAVDLRTVINNSVVFNDLGQVKNVQFGMINITQPQQSIFFSPINSVSNAYIIATFKADSVYSTTGITTDITLTNMFVFDGGGQTGTLSWQLVEVN